MPYLQVHDDGFRVWLTRPYLQVHDDAFKGLADDALPASTARAPYNCRQSQQRGSVLVSLGDFEATLKSHQKSLAFKEKVLGPEHQGTARCHNDIGSVLLNLGDFEAALTSYQKSLAIKEKVLGPVHPTLPPLTTTSAQCLRVWATLRPL